MSISREEILTMQEKQFTELAQQLQVRGSAEAPHLVTKTAKEVAAVAAVAKKQRLAAQAEETKFAKQQQAFLNQRR